jgi:hypothetical protein
VTWSLFPKIDKHIAWEILYADVPYGKLKYLPTVRKIPDDLWDEIELLLPSGKPNNTIGRPLNPFGKVLNGRR